MMRHNIFSRTKSFFVSVFIAACASLATAQIPNQLNTGFPENGIFHGSQIDNVQITNGGLHVEIPIYEAKARGFNIASKVVYNSKSWTFHTRCFTSGGGFCEDDVQGDPLGYPTLAFFGAFDYEFSTTGRTCQAGFNLFYSRVGGYTLREPDGTKHHFAPDPLVNTACIPWPQYAATIYADDGSGWIMQINPNDGTIIDAISKNGTRVIPPAGSAGLFSASLIVDANGNQMSSSSACCTQSGWGGTDTLGRVIPANGGYYDSSGTLRTPTLSGSVSVAIDTTPLCDFSSADSCVPDKSTWSLPNQLNLPNGDVYTFTYAQNAAGEPTSMSLPTGGQISWSWGNWDTGGRNVATRTVSDPAKGVAGTWTYFQGSAAVTDPAGKDTTYTCLVHSSSCNNVRTIQYFDGPAGSSPVLKTVSTEYVSYSLANSGGDPYDLPIRETTTWNQQNIVMKTETDWDTMTVSGVGTVNWRNPIEKRVFDWGSGAPGGLLQRVHSSYRHLESDGTAYLNFNIADLPTLVQSYDGAGNLVSQTQNYYDNTSITQTGTCQTPTVTNHDYCNYGTANATRGNLTTVSRWFNTANTWLNTTNIYDDLGNLRSTSDPLAHATTFDYTDNWGATGCVGATPTLAFPTTVTDALGHRTKTAYFPCTSLVQNKKDENDLLAGRPGTTYTYDLMNRPLVTQTLDAGSQILAKTSYSYNDSVIPLSITKTITGSPSPDVVSTVYMDGLGRTQQTQLNDPEGNVTSEITYDALGRKQTATNPHRSVAAATDGTLTNYFDALDRVVQVAPQDGTLLPAGTPVTQCQSNNTCTDYSQFPSVTTTDQTGKQRRTRADGLGRLVEVDEAGDAFSGTASAGTLTLNGTLLSTTVGGTGAVAASAQVTISGTNHFKTTIIRCTAQQLQLGCQPSSVTVYDTGKVFITVNGHEYDYFFGGNADTADSAASVAQGLVNAIQADPARVVNASVPLNGTQITLTAVTAGAAGNSITFTTGYTWNSNQFPTQGPSFTASPASGALAGGANATAGTPVSDSGTVNVTIGSFSASASYASSGNNTAALVAAALVSPSNPNSLVRAGSPVTSVSVSGSTISMTYATVGVAGNISVTASSSSSQPALFPSGSFSGSGSLTGGTDPYPSGLAHPYITLYSYDALGNLFCVEQHGNVTGGTACPTTPPDPNTPVPPDANNPWRRRLFAYDSLSRLRWASNPESGVVTYQYNSDSTLVSKTDARGVTTNYDPPNHGLDALHRVTQKTYSGTGVTDPAVNYTYDSATNGVGRLASQSTTASIGSNTYTIQSSFGYDALGRMNFESNCLPSSGCTGSPNPVTANFDAAGNLTSLLYPDGHNVATVYNAAGRMTSVASGAFTYYSVPQTQAANTWGYWPTGAMNRGTYHSGIIETTAYNNRLQISSIVDGFNGSTALFSKTYGYVDGSGHNNGNILAITDTLNSAKNQTFTYDSLNRIASGFASDNAFNLTFGYDPWGNMNESGTSNFNQGFNKLNRIAAFSYDASGDLLVDNKGHAYTYDAESRIKTVDGNVATYTYGADGNRVRKDANGVATEYVYFAGNVIAEKTVSSGAWTDYILGYGGKRLAKDTSTNGSAAQYYHGDHVGTARMMTDNTGTPVMNCIYNPFGEQVSCSPDNASNHYRFTGKERDAESGVDDFEARYFGSSAGRFMTPDQGPWKLQDPQYLNGYSYGLNNPLRYTDESGETPQDRVNAANAFANANPPIPYKFGGKDPACGLDCSGLVQNVFKADPDNTINLDTNAAGQAAAFQQQGEYSTDPNNAQPGDAIFFENDKGQITHVGVVVDVKDGTIYFVHAPHTGANVKRSSIKLKHPYQKIAGVGRPKETVGNQATSGVSASDKFKQFLYGLFWNALTTAGPLSVPNPEPNVKRRTEPPCLVDRSSGNCL